MFGNAIYQELASLPGLIWSVFGLTPLFFGWDFVDETSVHFWLARYSAALGGEMIKTHSYCEIAANWNVSGTQNLVAFYSQCPPRSWNDSPVPAIGNLHMELPASEILPY
jgi:hypothetical protein